MIPEPWLPDSAKTWFEKWLKPDMIGVEFGSGCSTVWLGQRVWVLMSVEHDPNWYRRVKQLLDEYHVEGVDLVYAEDVENYLRVLELCPDDSLDFIYSDGLAESRSPVLIKGWRKIRKGGVIVSDDSQYSHSSNRIRYLMKQGADYQVFQGEKTDPWTRRRNKNSETTVWIKK